MPLVLPNTLLFEVSINKLQIQQPSFQKWGFARTTHQRPGVCFSSDAHPADGCGLRISFCGESSAKVLRKSARRKSKCILKGAAQEALQKSCIISNNLSWDWGFRDASQLHAYKIMKNLSVWFGRWWMNLHKRSQEGLLLNMGYAKIENHGVGEKNTIFFPRENWPFAEKGI